MELVLWYKLGTRSRRAMLRVKKKWGHAYHYSPRSDLLQRLSQESHLTIEEVVVQLNKERDYLLRQLGRI